jgi:hypothetical protein
MNSTKWVDNPSDLLLQPMATRSVLEDFTLITHAVPAVRIRPHLPRELELETFQSGGGDGHGEKAFVSNASFFNRGFHAALLPFARLNFAQITYRTYVRYKGRRGVFFFATALSSRTAFMLQRGTSRIVHLGKYEREKLLGGEGYERYTFSMESDLGQTRFELEATERPHAHAPFKNGDELAQFLTYRQHGFLYMPGGILGDQKVAHERMHPLSGKLRSARFELWEKLGILRPHETLEPFSVLVQPRIPFTLFPPVPRQIAFLDRRHPDGLEAHIEAQSHKRAG